jgi:hypothetical protein
MGEGATGSFVIGESPKSQCRFPSDLWVLYRLNRRSNRAWPTTPIVKEAVLLDISIDALGRG